MVINFLLFHFLLKLGPNMEYALRPNQGPRGGAAYGVTRSSNIELVSKRFKSRIKRDEQLQVASCESSIN